MCMYERSWKGGRQIKILESQEKKHTSLIQLHLNDRCHSKLTLQQYKVKHEVTSVSFVSSIDDDCETSYYLRWHVLETLRNGTCDLTSVALILQTSADLGVCEDAPGRSNIHYEGNLICKSEWVCGRCFVVSKQTHSRVIAKKSLIKTNPTSNPKSVLLKYFIL